MKPMWYRTRWRRRPCCDGSRKRQIIDGDVMLAICAREMKRRGTLHKNSIVSTVMCNLGLIKALDNEGISVIQSQVGDRYVIQDMINMVLTLVVNRAAM